MFTRTTASEIRSCDNENFGFTIRLLVEDEIRLFRTIGIEAKSKEECRAETGSLDGLQELLRDDSISVDICSIHGCSNALEHREFWKASRGVRSHGVGV